MHALAEQQKTDVDHPRPCGVCTLCCKLYILPEFDKPAGTWCRHVVQGKGCAIHTARPQGCRSFQCVWSVTEALDDKWRPDNAGFVIASKDMQLFVEVDPGRPDSWRQEPYYGLLKRWSARNRQKSLQVVVKTRGRAIMIFPETDIDLGAPPEGSEIESGYEMSGGAPVPYARFVTRPQ